MLKFFLFLGLVCVPFSIALCMFLFDKYLAKKWKCLVILFLVVNSLMFFIPICYRHTTSIVESQCYDIQYAECPFGVYWTEGEGKFRFLFASGGGEFEFGMVENYVIKYWSGNELHTIILNAEETPVIVDGTFRLEWIIKVNRFFLIVFPRLKNHMDIL